MPGIAINPEIAKYTGQVTVSARIPQGDAKKVLPTAVREESSAYWVAVKEELQSFNR